MRLATPCNDSHPVCTNDHVIPSLTPSLNIKTHPLCRTILKGQDSRSSSPKHGEIVG